LREPSEGGKQQISNELKVRLIKDVIADCEALIDCEHRFLHANHALKIPPERLILSLHTDLGNQQYIREFIDSDIPARYHKLAISCERIEQLDPVIELLKKHKPDNFIMIPTFPCSLSARLVYKLYDSLGTYVHNDEAVIAHQPSLDMVSLCRMEAINLNTEFYAIIGKEQILHSLSVIVYNKWFEQTGTNRIFLPVVANTAEEALGLVNWIRKRNAVKGVAVTMPFKLSVSQIIDNTQKSVNTWLPQSKEYFNTDAIAMQEAIRHFKLKKGDNILIYGKGGTARTTQQVLEQMGFHNTQQMDRRDMHESTVYRLLINCTPFGLDALDSSDSLPDFEALIDLPYGKESTVLVKKAITQKVEYVDGFTFWKWQAKAQSDFFGIESEFKDFIDTLDLQAIVQ
jgi:shikimate 5-dehydrogenase